MFAKKAFLYLTFFEIRWCDKLEEQILNTILKNCPDLKALQIETGDFEGGYESVGISRKLNELSLNGPAILDNTFQYISSQCHELKKLELAFSDTLTDKAFEEICTRCPLLEHISLESMDELTDGIFECFFKYTYIKFLEIKYCKQITGAFLDCIPIYFIHLQRLVVFSHSLKKQSIEKLQRKMPQLEIEHGSTELEPFADINLEDVSFFE